MTVLLWIMYNILCKLVHYQVESQLSSIVNFLLINMRSFTQECIDCIDFPRTVI